MRRGAWGVVVCCFSFAGNVIAQQPDAYAHNNTFTVFAEYSNTSSHIVAGEARQRKLGDLGFAYTRRVVGFWGSELGYHIELRPVMFESDPLQMGQFSYSVPTVPPQIYNDTENVVPIGPCVPSSGTNMLPSPGEPTITETYNIKCGRQWTFGEGFSPFGFKYSTRTRHKVQPYLLGTLGYMYTSRPVPVANAESLNFLIDVGVGIEVFRSKTRSIALECRVHHFSNRYTAEANPGADNVMYGVAYSFGR